jgi:hypothetical protein
MQFKLQVSTAVETKSCVLCPLQVKVMRMGGAVRIAGKETYRPTAQIINFFPQRQYFALPVSLSVMFLVCVVHIEFFLYPQVSDVGETHCLVSITVRVLLD